MRPSHRFFARRVFTFAVLGAMLAFTAAPVDAATPSFAPPSWVPVTSPYSMTAADFDGDGRVDLAVFEGVVQQVVILHNEGNAFSRSTYPLGRNIGLLTPGDIDGDGDLDLIMESTAGKAVQLTVLPNLGQGVFGSLSQYGLGTYRKLGQMGVALGDLNGDRQPDVAAPSGGATYVLQNDGGRLGPATSYPLSGTRGMAAALADLNGDAALDLVVAHWYPSGVEVRFGAGDGTFGNAQDYLVSGRPIGLTAADIDGDGAVDLVMSRASSDKLAVLLNDGTGHFPTRKNYAVGGLPSAPPPVVADFDRDGRPDVAVGLWTSTGTASIAVISSLGGRRFAAPTFYTGGRYPIALVTADFDQDSRLDLAVATDEDDAIGVLLQQ